MVQRATWTASESCSRASDGRWHYAVQFHLTLDGIGTGTVRYQWGRGPDDARSDVRSHDVGVRYAFVTVHVQLEDTLKGSADSPTDTVVDRLRVLAPPGLDGRPFVATMVHAICP